MIFYYSIYALKSVWPPFEYLSLCACACCFALAYSCTFHLCMLFVKCLCVFDSESLSHIFEPFVEEFLVVSEFKVYFNWTSALMSFVTRCWCQWLLKCFVCFVIVWCVSWGVLGAEHVDPIHVVVGIRVVVLVCVTAVVWKVGRLNTFVEVFRGVGLNRFELVLTLTSLACNSNVFDSHGSSEIAICRDTLI